MITDPQITALSELAGYYERLRTCRSCELCQKEGHIQKSFDRCLVMYTKQFPIPVAFIGEAPAYCEERTGEPLTGFWELLESRCGVCNKLRQCHSYFLHGTDSYKGAEVVCPFAAGDEPEPLPNPEMFAKRIKMIPPTMFYACDPQGTPLTEQVDGKTVRIEDPRNAGVLFDQMLGSTGFIRATAAQYWKDKIHLGMADEALRKTPNCAIGNTVSCRPWALDKETGGTKKNVQPTLEQRIACGVHLYNFLQVVRPKVVVALGTVALSSLIGLRIILNTEGHALETEQIPDVTLPTLSSVYGKELTCTLVPNLGYELKVIPMSHPAAHLRSLHRVNGETPEQAATRLKTYRDGIQRDCKILRQIHTDYIGGI